MSLAQPHRAIVIGATGLIGKFLVPMLAESGAYRDIIVLTRRPAGFGSTQGKTAITEQIVPDFNELGSVLAGLDLKGCDAFSTLGTTLKQAGSKEAFEAIDYGLNVAFAEAVKQGGARRYFLVSAMGVSEQSLIFYNRVKARLENTVSALAFDQTVIFQPSLLLGQHTDSRPAEALAQKAFQVLNRVLPATFGSRPIEAERVARSMMLMATRPEQASACGTRIISNADMLKMTL